MLFCFINFDDKYLQNKTNEISVANYNIMAKSLKKSLHHLNFTGGEPFLRSDFGEIISNFIDNCNLSSIVISTNGSYPKRIKKFLDEICKKYKDKNLFFNFIDSFPEEHNKIRKIPGLFDKTIESYEMVKNSFSNCIATCNLTISEDNCENIEQIYDFNSRKKIHTINPIV